MKARYFWLLSLSAPIVGLIALSAYMTHLRQLAAQGVPTLAADEAAARAREAAAAGKPVAKGGNTADEAALMKNAEAFVAAFGKGDAKALSEFWTPNGDFTDAGGHTIVGREAIEKSFAHLFSEHKGLTLRIDITGLRFVTPEVAIEDGTTAVIHPDGTPPNPARYSIVHVKKDGKWWLESVRESPYSPPTNYKHLKVMDWAIGEWVDDVKGGEVAQISFAWVENQNFLLSHFHTSIKGAIVHAGTQWIGWDPTNKSIHSWMFESHGGFAQATWAKEDGKWIIRSTGVLPDGKKTSATNVVTRIDAHTITWEVKDRVVGGEKLPEIKPVKMKRLTLPEAAK